MYHFSFPFPQSKYTLTNRNQMRKNVFETDRKAHCNGVRYRCKLAINLYPHSLATFQFFVQPRQTLNYVSKSVCLKVFHIR